MDSWERVRYDVGMFAIGDKEWPGISKLVEECGETLQVAGKLMGSRGTILHWDGSNLKTRLEDELADLIAAATFVADNCRLDRERIRSRADSKLALFRSWHAKEDPLPLTKIDTTI